MVTGKWVSPADVPEAEELEQRQMLLPHLTCVQKQRGALLRVHMHLSGKDRCCLRQHNKPWNINLVLLLAGSNILRYAPFIR